MLLGESKYPSFEEFNFELTENLICSPSRPQRFSGPSKVSLQYTASQISIDNELEDQVPFYLNQTPYLSIKDKESGYMTASTHHTLASAKTTFQTLRSKTLSYQQHSSLHKIKATLAVCPIFFEDHSFRDERPHSKGKSKEKFRLRKSVSVRERKGSQNLGSEPNRFAVCSKEEQAIKLQILKKAFKVKSINLESNDAREKVYLKKLIQNRASIIHISQSYHQPWETRRSTFKV